MKNKTQKNPTVTIGIPAYNEAANIGYLIEDLIKQDTKRLVLEKILIISDGSTDDTIKTVNKFKNKRIQLIDTKKRQGLAKTQNEIFKNSDSDILVLLNADIMIKNSNFIKKIIEPIIKDQAELTSSSMNELESPTYIGRVLNMSMDFKKAVFENFKNGNNIYTCHGTARAFSKKVYKNIVFKESIGEDAYSYLFTTFNSHKYVYAKPAIAYYKLPTNLKDHELQSVRFLQSKKKFIKEFGLDFVNKSYAYPTKIMLLTLIKFFIRHPFYMSSYFLIYFGMKVKNLFSSKIKNTWEISKSSKSLRAF